MAENYEREPIVIPLCDGCPQESVNSWLAELRKLDTVESGIILGLAQSLGKTVTCQGFEDVPMTGMFRGQDSVRVCHNEQLLQLSMVAARAAEELIKSRNEA